jgi:uncharacterized glyoxalase superfamily protein PhnB
MERAIPILPVEDLDVAKGSTGHGREACVSLMVDDADAYYAEWRTRVEIRRPPQDESWGARTFGVIDPFGNTIFVMGPTT